jgi:RNA polymerase sigma factor (sigma-70 family)
MSALAKFTAAAAADAATDIGWLAVQRYAQPIVARILRKCPDDVPDIIQSATLRAFTHLHTFRGDCSFSTWFVSIAVRTALMHLRTRPIKLLVGDKFVPADQFDMADDDIDPEQAIIQAEHDQRIRSAVHEAIRTLSPRRRIAAHRWLNGSRISTSAEKAARYQARLDLKERLRVLHANG